MYKEDKCFGVLSGRLTGGSYSNIGIESGTVTGSWEVGSLAGRSTEGATFTDCYSKANVVSNTKIYSIGGIVGNSKNRNVTLTRCYFAGSITGGDGKCATLCANDGGTVSITNCYYNNASGKIPSNVTNIQGTGLTNFGSMTSLPSGFSSNTWKIVDGYPTLKVFK